MMVMESWLEDMERVMHEREVRPVPPGEVLRDVLEDVGMLPADFARSLGVPLLSLEAVLQDRAPVTVDLAIRIGKVLGNGPQLWLNLQRKVDLWDAVHDRWHEYQALQPLQREHDAA